MSLYGRQVGKGSEAVQQQQQQLTLLGIKTFGPTFSGSGLFAYSHLHTPIKQTSYRVHHEEFRKLLLFYWHL